MKHIAVLLILLCGCADKRFNRTYRTKPSSATLLRTPLARIVEPSIQDLTPPELPKLSRMWFSTNATPKMVHFEWDNWPTNLATVFEWTTNMSTWQRGEGDGCNGSPPAPLTRNAATIARDGFTAVRMRLIAP